MRSALSSSITETIGADWLGAAQRRPGCFKDASKLLIKVFGLGGCCTVADCVWKVLVKVFGLGRHCTVLAKLFPGCSLVHCKVRG
eukprot:1157249-Pelagomonas_calceolata.AAC.13